jgi:lactate permease
MLYSLLALVPLVALLLLSLWRGLNVAIGISFLLTVGLFFVWQAPLGHLWVSLLAAVFSTLNILMIVLGALFLYRVMEGTGYVEGLSTSLRGVHPDREIHFFLMVIGLTPFFEGVAGFGTPGAIVPLLLIALGYDAVLAVSAVLLMNGLVGLAGAVGTPVLTGFEVPLGLDRAEVRGIYVRAAALHAVYGAVVVWFIIRAYQRGADALQHRRSVWLMYAFYAGALLLFSAVAGPYSLILAAIAMLGLSALVLRRGREPLDLRPWVPYAVLVGLLLLPRLVAPLRRVVEWEWRWSGAFGTDHDVAFSPLAVPLLPFIAVGLGVMVMRKSRRWYARELAQKIGSMALILFPAVALSQLMVNSDGPRPSMVAHLAGLLERTGPLYVFFAPLLGVLGTFITGSTTVSNLIFGAAQQQTAQTLRLDEPLILALQLCGAALGNAVSLFNIIAAATVANVADYRPILRQNLVPILVAGLVAGLGGWVLLRLG